MLHEKLNAKYDSKNSFRLTVSMFVVFPGIKEADFKNLLFNSHAGIVIVLYEPALNHILCHVVKEVADESEHWIFKKINNKASVLYRKDIIRRGALIEGVGEREDNDDFQTLRVFFWASTAVAVGVLYRPRSTDTGYRLAPYSASLLDGITTALTPQQVQLAIVGGYPRSP